MFWAIGLVGLIWSMAHDRRVGLGLSFVAIVVFWLRLDPVIVALPGLYYILFRLVRYRRPPRSRIVMSKRLRRRVWRKKGSRCYYCGEQAEHLDHIVPYWFLARTRRPVHRYNNLVPACATCNQLAGGRVFRSFRHKRDWVREQRGLAPCYPWWVRILGGSLDGERRK